MTLSMLTGGFWEMFRFWSRVDFSGDCWNWIGYKLRPNGYGRVSVNGTRILVHRLAYQRTGKAIPRGLQIDHLCRNKACVNPGHMEPVSNKENHRRAVPFHPMTLRTHCPNGHEYSAENTRMYLGRRHCRECGRVASRKWKVRVGY